MKKIAILYSGGLDSYILYHYAKITNPTDDIIGVYWDHGQEADEAEQLSLPDFVQVRKVDWLKLGFELANKSNEPKDNIYIPGRNLVFVTLTACQDLPDEIWLGAMTEEIHDKATDKNMVFLEKTNDVLSYTLSPFKDNIKLRFPFVELGLSKFTAIKWALDNGVTKEELIDTMSCYNPTIENNKVIRCGECRQCTNRFTIFGMLGFDELSQLKVHPLKSVEIRNQITTFIDNIESKYFFSNYLNDYKFIADYISDNTDLFDKDEWAQKTMNSIYNNVIPFLENETE